VKTLRTRLLTSLAGAAVAILAAGGQTQAAPMELGTFGAETTILTIGGNYVDGGPGYRASQKAISGIGSSGYGAYGEGSGSIGAGALHAYAFANHPECHSVPPLFTCDNAAIGTRAAIWDTISFAGLPIGSGALIPVSVTVDGHFFGGASGLIRNYVGYGGSGGLDVNKIPSQFLNDGQNQFLDNLYVTPSSPTIFLYLELYANAGADGDLHKIGLADYSHTLHFSWELPEGVTATSASGVFLTDVSAAPEPAAWALMLAGFGAAGGALRGRRRRRLA
jgi:hypothetical protein